MDYNKEFNINIKSSTPVITLTGTYTDDTSFNETFDNEDGPKTFINTNESLLKTIKIDEPTGIFTSCSGLFASCNNLTIIDLSTFNTSKVTDMSGMFRYLENLISIEVTSFNTENVTTMQAMFQSCILLTTLDLSSFNTENVTNMQSMFNNCPAVTEAYGRTQEDCDKLNASGYKSPNVNFVVKS